ncbi:MAG: hypothetical protein IKY92_00860 [Akkermansia sp.]|nr:hypothetical protein [Akkermansia sp.]
MRGLLPALILVASLPLAAWEALSPSELAAVQGAEPFATVLEAGVPLPPSRSDARCSAGWRYALERSALKLAMVYRTSRAKAERNRITPENNRITAKLARTCGTPELFCHYLEMLAEDTLSPRRNYALNQALNYLLQETYGIDTLQIRLVSETLQLAPADHMLYLLKMPVYGMYDRVPQGALPPGRLLDDVQIMTDVLRRADQELRKVHDRASAEAAALALQPLLPLWNTTRQSRHHLQQGQMKFSPAENMALHLLNSTMSRLVETRLALHAIQWHGSTCLQTIDELLR